MKRTSTAQWSTFNRTRAIAPVAKLPLGFRQSERYHLSHARDERGFIALVLSLLKDDARRHQLAADGRTASDREFSWKVIVNRLLPLLESGGAPVARP